MGNIDIKNNLKNFVITNDKNKIAKSGSFYYHVTMHENTEYNDKSIGFFEFNKKKFYLNGIEPLITVKNSSTNLFQYNFRNYVRNADDATSNIPVYVPQPNQGFSDQLRNVYDTVTTAHGIATECKPHICDMQIVVTTGFLHIFMLCDIITAYAPIEITANWDYRKISDWQGNYNRIVVYQQHAIAGDGSLTIVPTRKASFPMYNQPTGFSNTKYGKYQYKTLNIYSQGYNRSALLYYRDESVTDFDCGLIGSSNIYCLIGKTTGHLDLYSTSITFSDDKEWKYRTYYTGHDYNKFPQIITKDVPFNIYSHYLDNSNFYISYSHYNNGVIKYDKMLCDYFYSDYEWKLPYTVEKGYGFLIYNATTNKSTHKNFVYDTYSGKRYKRYNGTSNIGTNYNDNVKITKEDLQWKYKIFSTENGPKLGMFNFNKQSINENFAQSNDLLVYKNDVKPLTMSMSYYYNPSFTTDTYKYYGNMNGKKVVSEITYVGTLENTVAFSNTNTNFSLIKSGDYFLTWE